MDIITLGPTTRAYGGSFLTQRTKIDLIRPTGPFLNLPSFQLKLSTPFSNNHYDHEHDHEIRKKKCPPNDRSSVAPRASPPSCALPLSGPQCSAVSPPPRTLSSRSVRPSRSTPPAPLVSRSHLIYKIYRKYEREESMLTFIFCTELWRKISI